MTCVVGSKSYLAAVDEVTWDTFPGSPTYLYVPVYTFTPKIQPNNLRAEPLVGTLQSHMSRNITGLTQGQVLADLYGWEFPSTTVSLLQWWLDWMINSLESATRPSKSAEWAFGPNVDNRRVSGLVPTEVVIRGNTQLNRCQVEASLIGGTDSYVATAQSLPTDRNKLVPCEFPDVTLTVGGTPLLIAGFELRVPYKVTPVFLNTRTPNCVAHEAVNPTLTIVPLLAGHTYSDYVRTLPGETDLSLVLTIKGKHMGTGASGTYNIATLTMARCHLVRNQYATDGQSVVFEPLQFNVMKPQTADDSIEIAYSQA